ncbi:MAG: LysM peptidoglycan-binding domain-containing protein [Hoeflea sp.]|uniref:LysM peptidoglycan-binding domain-containing protein n=1 Tax=Hoeflea sp. TaxID=1940281 RepID=UPI001D815E8B|nr:LysM peptidoglycan-binding domain-containing protein [Hoeflea sp.]MBU4528405.1 LysM peptidoglycan-binding domain-containing protein [Alphaproteobacteria bacterium]MBU4543074.1 LysM peptidoglycan-binding domain-containing protein [Alphaproteobacteria bacterium]MBU4551765.1 LysM peptidoglycan-binding domain-containing protein [Alphaproteobacteria bacterium]MBV1723660.1 LysM peptidoglycan-binding domain-containing protein [Hoeflea sp.]MBV1761976.1 LysM peptidoglycan-binding domain-containing p
MINFGAGLAKIAGILKIGAGLPAIAGVIVAAAVGTYFVAPQVFKATEETVSEPAQVSGLADGAVTEPQAAPEEAAGTEVARAEPGEPADAGSWVTPSFDVLRVEPDGSTVIAGRAEPGTTLNIMNGETVIASTRVGPSGDFAAVLDEPLAPGDYQLTLETVGQGGETRRSEEVATVSIPKEAGGDLLAMVSKPGQASRIIVQPEAPAIEKPVEMASTGSGEADSVPAVTPAAPEIAAPEIVAPEAATPETATVPESEVTDSAAAPASVETPPLPDASSLLTTTAPEMAAEDKAEAETATASGADAVTGAEPSATPEADVTAEPAAQPATEVAMATPEAAAEQAATDLPAGATVRVDAVEIEGERVFVAGSATPGYPVRVSADGVVIGMEKADETGRFIIEAISELSVGEHIINADLMDRDGQEVLLRATVPFSRPEGESLAAVAPSSAVTAEPAAPDALILPDIASLSKMREESFEALSMLQRMVSAPETPDASAVSAAYDEAVAKLKGASIADLPEGSSAEAMAMAQSMRAQAEAALTAIMPTASIGAGQPLAAGGADSATHLGKLSESVKRAETALSEPAEIAVAAANSSDPAGVAGGQGEPRTIVQAPLASTPGAVIIRRGDTLWQISRRTYGQGVRYTTIYVANRSQIQNPDRIKPGQVFSVPESPLENAEELHKQLLSPAKKP